MNNDLAVFKVGETEFPMNITDLNGQRWIPATQLGEALGHSNIHNFILNSDEVKEGKHWVKVSLTRESDGQKSPTTLLSYYGVIRVCMRANSERAKQFRDWAEDVLFQVMTKGEFVSGQLAEKTAEAITSMSERIADLELSVSELNRRNIVSTRRQFRQVPEHGSSVADGGAQGNLAQPGSRPMPQGLLSDPSWTMPKRAHRGAQLFNVTQLGQMYPNPIDGASMNILLEKCGLQIKTPEGYWRATAEGRPISRNFTSRQTLWTTEALSVLEKRLSKTGCAE